MATSKDVPSILNAALEYAQAGLKVIPIHGIKSGVCTCSKGKDCKHPGKHPMTSNGLKDGTTNSKQIKRWFTDEPNANVAIVTGDGLVVIDIDKDAGGIPVFKKLEEVLGKLPKKAVVQTGGGGFHVYLKTEKEIRNSSGKLGQGIDVRGDGGYIIAPPSMHVSGKRYKWWER